MKRIAELVDNIKEELCDSKHYAECYLYEKAKGSNKASQFKQMAQDELNHASILHDIAVDEVELLKATYTPPVEMQKAWQEDHAMYVEQVAWLKQMLAM